MGLFNDESDRLLGTYMGMKVYTNSFILPLPKIKLSPLVPVSDTFRASMDAWLLEMFGTEEAMYVVNDLAGIGEPCLIVSPNIGKKLREHLAHHEIKPCLPSPTA